MEYKLLIVDDDYAIRSFLEEALKDAGYEVEKADNGAVALKILENQNLIISSNAMTLISALSYGHLDGAIVYKSDYMNSIYNSNSFRISEDNIDK